MKTLTTILLMYISFLGFSQTKVKSFYFNNNNTEPTLYSQEQLRLFAETATKGQIELLEINSFTDSIGSKACNDTLAVKRLNYVKSRLPYSTKTTYHPYALARPYSVDKILNWRRVDVFYTLIDIPSADISANTVESIQLENEQAQPAGDLSHLTEDPTYIETPKEINEFDQSLTSMQPLVLDIQFKEGKAIILESSYREVTKLAVYLNEHPTIKAEIRGHVCCGNNMRISKQRAKAIYKRLIRQGIDKERLSFVGKSNSEPLVFPEKTNDDRQKNRRVDVKFSY